MALFHSQHDDEGHGRDAMDFTLSEGLALLSIAGMIGIWNWLKAFPVTFVNWLKVWWIIVASTGLSIGLVTYSFPGAVIGGFVIGYIASTVYHWYTVRAVT